MKLIYLTFVHCTCKFEKHKHSFLNENYEQTFPNKNYKKAHIKVEGDESWSLHIMGDCPVGFSSLRTRWSTFLKNESKFDCVRCSTLISLLKTDHFSMPHCFWFDIKGYLYSYILFQYWILLKDSGTSPSVVTKTDFVSKPIGTGVSLHGATSKRDSMWHNPVFICIRANRIPVNRVNRSVFFSNESEPAISLRWTSIAFHRIYNGVPFGCSTVYSF